MSENPNIKVHKKKSEKPEITLQQLLNEVRGELLASLSKIDEALKSEKVKSENSIFN